MPIAFSAQAAAGGTPPGVSPADRVAVQAILDGYAAAWAAGDAVTMMRLATPDIHWVNIVGMHWQGRDQVELAHKVYLEAMFRGVPLHFEEIESIVPIGSEVLAVVTRCSVGAFSPPSGGTIPAADDRMSLILQRTSAGLKIAHGANIQIDPNAAPFDPVKGKPAHT